MPGFTNIYAYMKQLRGSGLTLQERGVLLAIASYANRDGTNAHPGHENLAEDLSVEQLAHEMDEVDSRLRAELPEVGEVFIDVTGHDHTDRG